MRIEPGGIVRRTTIGSVGVHVRILHAHDTTLTYHQQIGTAWLNGDVRHLDAIGRVNNGGTYRWLVAACQHASCPFEAVVRSSDIDSIVNQVTL